MRSDVNVLIALCHILDDFEKFNQDLAKVMTDSSNKLDVMDFAIKMLKISKGEFVLGSGKIKKFYEKYKNVISTIDQYCDVCDFICFNYEKLGNLVKASELEFFYSYFLTHRDKLDKILRLLNKMRELGIRKVIFNEEADFTEGYYFVSPSLQVLSPLSYFDNMYVKSWYNTKDDDEIMYSTTGSDYCIDIDLYTESISNDKDFRGICLKSFLIDPNRLPNNISKESLISEIVRLRDGKGSEYVAIKNSVDLTVHIDNLYASFNSISEFAEKVDGVKYKGELRELLLEIRQNLDKLRTIGEQYDDSIFQEFPSITKSFLDWQKSLYLKERKKIY